MKQIIINAIVTPDETVLVSENRHDFKTHEDTKTKKRYGVDGGTEYCRMIGDITDCKDITLYIDDDEIVDEYFKYYRNIFKWGTYGKSGKEKYKQVKLKDMSNSHIKNIFETQKHLSNKVLKLFQKELKYRDDNKVIIL